MDDDVGFGCFDGDGVDGVVVAFDDVDLGVALAEGLGDVAEEDGDVVFRVFVDECVEDGATDVACCSCPSWVELATSHSRVVVHIYRRTFGPITRSR